MALTVAINQKAGQLDPSTFPAQPKFTIVFGEPIVVSSLTANDIGFTGTAVDQEVVSITEVAPNNGTTYELTVKAATTGTIIPSVKAGVTSAAGGVFAVSTSTDNTVNSVKAPVIIDLNDVKTFTGFNTPLDFKVAASINATIASVTSSAGTLTDNGGGNWRLRYNPSAAGTTTITVTVTDSNGIVTTDTVNFIATVIPDINAPKVSISSGGVYIAGDTASIPSFLQVQGIGLLTGLYSPNASPVNPLDITFAPEPDVDGQGNGTWLIQFPTSSTPGNYFGDIIYIDETSMQTTVPFNINTVAYQPPVISAVTNKTTYDLGAPGQVCDIFVVTRGNASSITSVTASAGAITTPVSVDATGAGAYQVCYQASAFGVTPVTITVDDSTTLPPVTAIWTVTAVAPPVPAIANLNDTADSINSPVCTSFDVTFFTSLTGSTVTASAGTITALSIDAKGNGSYQLCYTPTVVGDTNITVSAKDPYNQTTTDVVKITGTPPPTPPSISNPTDSTTNINTQVCTTFVVTAGSAPATITSSAGTLTNTGGNNWQLCYTPTAVGDTTITIDATSADGNATQVDWKVTATPAPVGNFTVDQTALTIGEAGGTAGFAVVLTIAPLGNVVITAVSSNPSDATVSPATFTFTPLNWNVPQLALVTAVNDTVLGDGSSTITISVDDALSSNEFDAAADKTVAITVTNEDVPVPPITPVIPPVNAVKDVETCVDFDVTLGTGTSITSVTSNLGTITPKAVNPDGTGTYTLCYTPPNEGDNNVIITIEDNNGDKTTPTVNFKTPITPVVPPVAPCIPGLDVDCPPLAAVTVTNDRIGLVNPLTGALNGGAGGGGGAAAPDYTALLTMIANKVEFDKVVLCNKVTGAKVILVTTYSTAGVPTVKQYNLDGTVNSDAIANLVECEGDAIVPKIAMPYNQILEPGNQTWSVATSALAPGKTLSVAVAVTAVGAVGDSIIITDMAGNVSTYTDLQIGWEWSPPSIAGYYLGNIEFEVTGTLEATVTWTEEQ
jgi:hypothetical protein